MKITAVENIPYADKAFAQFGDVTIISDKELTAKTVKDTDILLTRSTVKINKELLEGSRVQFVGTATIGVDHVDQAYLAAQNITFASAPGSNATSVSEYITMAMLELADAHNFQLKNATLGVIGCGNVGSRVVKKAAALGMHVIMHDPPLKDTTGDTKYRPLSDIFDADIITAHVPLVKTGPYPTPHLINDNFIKQMKSDAMLINSSRGAVADGASLHRAFDTHQIRDIVLDVWEDEPCIDTTLRQKVFISTPHIAGHSFDGKVKGARMLYEAVCTHLHVQATWDPAPLLPAPLSPKIEVHRDCGQKTILEVVRQVYNIWSDHHDFKKQDTLAQQERIAYFKKLRKNYPMRREFPNTQVQLPANTPALSAVFAGLNFSLHT